MHQISDKWINSHHKCCPLSWPHVLSCFLRSVAWTLGQDSRHRQQELGFPCAGACTPNSPAVAKAACSLQYFPGVSGLVFRRSWKRAWENRCSFFFPLQSPRSSSAPLAGCSTARLLGGEPAHRLTPRPPGSAPPGLSSAVTDRYRTGNLLSSLKRNCSSPWKLLQEVLSQQNIGISVILCNQ